MLQTTPNLPFENRESLIQPEHVAGILSNIMGLTGSHALPEVSLPAGGFLRQPKTNFLVVIEGSAASSELNSLASFDVHSNTAESASDLLNRMFSGKEAASEIELASVGDLLCQLNADSVVLSVASSTEMLRSIALNSQLLKSHPNWNVFSALVNLQTSAATMNEKSQVALKQILEQILSTSDLENYNVFESGSPVFDLTIKVSILFHIHSVALLILCCLSFFLFSMDFGF